MHIKPFKEVNEGTRHTIVDIRIVFHEPQDMIHSLEANTFRRPRIHYTLRARWKIWILSNFLELDCHTIMRSHF